MKKIWKRTLVMLLVVIMVGGAAPMSVRASAKTISEYAQGDLVEFGWYPQSEVKDGATLTALNSASQSWHSYGYYTGTGSWSDGNMTPSGYMEYTDVEYGGQKYRGVRFSQYRPYYTGYTSSAGNTYQDDNGYNQFNHAYWFQWEPLQWRVLDPNTGLVLCETIIDSQPYNNYILSSGRDEYGQTAYWGDAGKTHYANNYAESSIHDWLTRESDKSSFLNTAFTKAQRDGILETTLDNSAYSTSYSAYDSASTTDKIFLLSYSEALNPAYGFSSSDRTNDAARCTTGSDYAKCQGLNETTYLSNKCSVWRLRSAGTHSSNTCYVYSGYNGGSVSSRSNYCSVDNTNFGIRPALRLNLQSEIFQSDPNDPNNPDDPDDPDPSSVRISKMPTKTVYTYRNDTSLDLSGMELEVTYSDGSKKTVADTSAFKVSGYSAKPRGEKTVTVEYEGVKTDFKVTVKYAWWQILIRIFLLGFIWY